MLSIAMIVVCIGLTFAYRATHHNPRPVIGKRVRIGLSIVIMGLAVTAGYLLPIEIARGLERLSSNQSSQQAERAERKMAAERLQVGRMIALFGSSDRYLAYLQSQNRARSGL